jgi:hypothetical protein
MFSQSDLFQIQQKGITIDKVTRQIELFTKGFPYLKLIRPAIRHDGVVTFKVSEIEHLLTTFETYRQNKHLIKFVPASGAATRMFKIMFDQLSITTAESLIPGEFSQIITQIELFAFYNDLKDVLSKNNLSLSQLIKDGSYHQIISYILSEEGLNYSKLPKGLLKFHNYPEGSRTAIEEHLVEGALYGKNADGSVNIHFTVSPEHLQDVYQLINEVKIRYEQLFHVVFKVVLSVQNTATDSIAVDGNNLPFRNDDGSLLFRPGGHGALLENLSELDDDIIFIKNIDNVVPDRLKNQTVIYKKVLAGLLLQVQKKVFEYLHVLDNHAEQNDKLFTEIKQFIESSFGYRFSPKFDPKGNEARSTIMKILNRPIRVCGMVQNVGEPGGGPYWVEHSDFSQSLQILESTQINLDDDKQRALFKQATHFNPVDLVLAIRNYKGQKFNLSQFRDPNTGFISIKSKEGKELKALELPGLWNGAMAFWNTIFVEVPIITFNPVKTINDLLRMEHQNY